MSPPPPPTTPPPPPTTPGPPPGFPGPAGGPAPAYPYPGVQPTVGGERAGFGIRLGAWLLDGLLYGLVAMVFVIPGFVVGALGFQDCEWVETEPNTWEAMCPPGAPDGGLIAAGIAIGLLGWLFVVVLYVRAMGKSGQTWGARIVGVRVIDARTGSPIGFGRALGRSLFANIISSIFYIGYLWMLWDDKQQTWQDKVVDSIVIRT
jgi:uncharacterized RDD family membrane protein YckC